MFVLFQFVINKDKLAILKNLIRHVVCLCTGQSFFCSGKAAFKTSRARAKKQHEECKIKLCKIKE